MFSKHQEDRFLDALKGELEISFNPKIMQEMFKYISDDFEPQDIFDEKTLRQWAYDNGMVDKEPE